VVSPSGVANTGTKGQDVDDRASKDLRRVARNTFFLTAQPLVMNVLSLLSVAYIARTLGVEDFGAFNLMITFTTLFAPVAQLGLNRVMVRDMAASADRRDYAARILPVRVALVAAATVVLLIAAWLGGYHGRIQLAIAAGTSIFVFQSLAEIGGDIFLACEETRHTAVAQFIGGLTLTLLSVAVLYLGFGLFAMIATYAFGQFLGFALILHFLRTRLFPTGWTIDVPFALAKLRTGLPFFASTMMWSLIGRVDTLAVGGFARAVDLGYYTSSMLLVSRGAIVAQGVSTALLPAVARLHAAGDTAGVTSLVRKVSEALFIVTLPGVAYVAAFAAPIAMTLFGGRYAGAAPILAIGVWAIVVRCVAAVQFSVLAGCGRERAVMASYAITVAFAVPATWLLVRFAGIVGGAVATVASQIVLAALFAWHSPIRRTVDVRPLALSAAIGAGVWALAAATRGLPVLVSMALVAALGAAASFSTGHLRLGALKGMWGR
jgi:O-antigen/teichoic acid export membrane protein